MKKIVDDLPDGWKATVLSLYKEGASDTEVRAALDMTWKLWRKLLLTDVEFEDVILHGRMLSKAWWMKAGRVNLENKEFNAALFKINMQNRFNWTDKASTTSIDDEQSEGYEDGEALDEAIKSLTKNVSVN